MVGVDAAEQVGRGERHGGIFKTNMASVVNAHQVCGKAEMKIAATIAKEYRQGDLIVYMKDQGGSDWHGPARILDFEENVAWCLHGSIPVAASVNRLKPANADEILAYMSLSRPGTMHVQRAAGEQQGFLDVSRIRPRQED